MMERINTYRVLARKCGGKRLLVRPRRRWNDNIKTDFQEVEWDGMWLRTETRGELLYMWSLTSGFRKVGEFLD
jgi:hypothetical protein